VSARESPALSSLPTRLALEAGFVVLAGTAAVVLGLSPAAIAVVLVLALVAMAVVERAGRRPALVYPEADRRPPPEEPPPVAGDRAERAGAAGEWNLWELERRARDYAGGDAVPEEWAAMFRHLREFARSDGALPPQFDSLVRESFPQLTQ
jgi:hypothetical protein